MVVGTDTAGSYNLAESGQSLHSYFIEDHIDHVKSLIDNNIIPEVLALNGFKLNYKDTPKFICSPISKPDVDNTSKMVQRLRATSSIVLTKDNIISWHKRAGFDTEHMEAMTQDELIDLLSTEADDAMSSRSGSGMTSGMSNGTGNIGTQAASGGDASLANNENSMTKSVGDIKIIKDDGVVATVQIGNKQICIPSEDIKDL